MQVRFPGVKKESGRREDRMQIKKGGVAKGSKRCPLQAYQSSVRLGGKAERERERERKRERRAERMKTERDEK